MPSPFPLSPLQIQGVEWLQERDTRYLADPPGFGKTRQLLAAVGEVPTLVVAPAAIRDAGVWTDEADRIGWDAPMRVISYHQLAQGSKSVDPMKYRALVFDEAHYLKNRKVSWGDPAVRAARMIPVTYMGSGTPTPNNASELWGQLRVLDRDIRAFWPWADGNTKQGATGWFHVTTKKDKAGNVLSDYVIEGHLQACVDAGCYNGRIDPKSRFGELLPITVDDCEHWAGFRRVVQAPWMFGRPEDLLDLPPMSGVDDPLWTPMKPAQKKLYKELAEKFLASLPEHDIELEAISQTQQFVQLWQLSTGVSCVDPTQDLEDKHSGKFDLVREMLNNRSNPVLVGCYFRNTAQALVRMCERMGKKYATFGANTTPAARRAAVQRFQAGEIEVMVGSIAVVGEGLTLTAADSVYLVERMWTPDKNTQVIRRVLRRGQNKPVGVRQFVTPKAVDEGQWETLKNKTNRISKVDVTKLVYGVLG